VKPSRLWTGLAGCLIAAGLVACGERRHAEPPPAARFEGSDLRVELESRSPAPRAGDNQLRLRVTDAGGAPVADAEIELRWRMDMSPMPPMLGRATARPLGGGAYEADVPLGMPGTWQLAVEVRSPRGESARAEGSLTTGTPGIRLEEPGAAPEGDRPRDASAAHRPASPPAAGEVRIDAARRQKIGIRTAPVRRDTLVRRIRTAGRVAFDERSQVDVTARVGGFVERLDADALGERVERGEPLLSLYGPELLAAQQELLQALASQAAARGTGAPDRADARVRAAEQRLRLWGIAEADIAALARRGQASPMLVLRAPASGYVIEKNVVEGAAVSAGMRLFRIAPLDPIWIEAQVPQSDLSLVAPGQTAHVTLPDLPGRRLEARVETLLPQLAAETRSGRVRLVVPNPTGELRPDAWAEVDIEVALGERVLVPASAVIYAGPRRVVFVDLGEGRLAPRDVEVGVGNGEDLEVLAGLVPGEEVVVSGNFLVAAESRLRSALEAW
jgi:Cu(I)/Ag(I) efflux system membrane fusion protein